MAYSSITRTAKGRDAINYALGINGKGHNGKETRNQYISFINLPLQSDKNDKRFINAFESVWKHARKNHTCQMLRIVISYSLNELDPNNPADILKADEIGQKFAKENYPNRQAVIFTQIDGKSGLIHTHILISDVEMETYKGCENRLYKADYVADMVDKTIEESGITLDYGQGMNKEEWEASKKGTKNRDTYTERNARAKGQYVWKDDLKARISSCMASCTSEEQFINEMKKNGVLVEIHDAKTTKKKDGTIINRDKYYTYTLTDTSKFPDGQKVPERRKARSNKLGTDYDVKTIIATLQRNKEQEEQEEQQKHSVIDAVEPHDGTKPVNNTEIPNHAQNTHHGANIEHVKGHFITNNEELAFKLGIKAQEEEKRKAAKESGAFFGNAYNKDLERINKRRNVKINGVDFSQGIDELYDNYDDFEK